MKIETKFDIGDTVYKMFYGTDCIELHIEKIIISKDNINYEVSYYSDLKSGKTTTCLEESEFFSTKEECEKNYVLKKFGHLFKDTKTLK